MKPDITKIANPRHGSYDKLNDMGYAPEETHLENGDAIFGKVTPIADPTSSGKPYRDVSETFKMHASGVVDRVYIDVQNQDGYMTREALIRSERIPKIGDKYCFPESANIEVMTDAGWQRIQDLSLDDKIASFRQGNLVYDSPTNIYQFNYDGKIHKIRSKHIDLDVTADHELYVAEKNNDTYNLVSAHDLIGKKYSMKKNCDNANPDLSYVGDYVLTNLEDKQSLFESYARIFCNARNSVTDIMLSNENWVWELSQLQTQDLIQKMLEYFHSQDCVLVDGNKTFVNHMMKLAIHAGWSGEIAPLCDNRYGDIALVFHDHYQFVLNTETNEPEIDETMTEVCDYNGKVYCLELPEHIFMVRQNGKNVWVGNCSRMGQKGTIGILLSGADMPFTKEGMRPDIIVNPNAIPSRMTIGQLLECLVGKVSALQGMDADGTTFEEYDLESVKDKLEKLGYNRNGYEYLYNGMTGEKMKVAIYIGPTYYQRLKHLVEDKIHSRSRGPKTSLTRQSIAQP